MIRFIGAVKEREEKEYRPESNLMTAPSYCNRTVGIRDISIVKTVKNSIYGKAREKMACWSKSRTVDFHDSAVDLFSDNVRSGRSSRD
jgi:hypothetical protein